MSRGPPSKISSGCATRGIPHLRCDEPGRRIASIQTARASSRGPRAGSRSSTHAGAAVGIPPTISAIPWCCSSPSSSPGPISTSLVVSPGRIPITSMSGSPSFPAASRSASPARRRSARPDPTRWPAALPRPPAARHARPRRRVPHVIQYRSIPVSVTVRGTPARDCRRKISDTAAGAARTFTNRTAVRCAPARRAASTQLLHEPLRPAVEAGGQRGLVRRRDDDRLDAGRLGGA